MAKVAPFHSKKPGTTVHHNDTRCTEGNNIEPGNKASGTGGLPLCSHCKRLTQDFGSNLVQWSAINWPRNPQLIPHFSASSLKVIRQKRGENMKLPFPTRIVQTSQGEIEEYIIPEDKKAEVLNSLYPFEGVPSLDEERYDLHAEKNFKVKDYRVTWEEGMNYLVSPYYFEGGGTVIDWMPTDLD